MAPLETVVLGHNDQKKLNDIIDILADAGLKVHSTTDGEKVIEYAREFKPDLVLVDVLMPGINGFEICREVKGISSRKYLPVVLMTDRDDAYSRGRGRYVGADEVLEYPLSPRNVQSLMNFPYEDSDHTGKLLAGNRRKQDKFLNALFRDGVPVRPDGLVARITDPLTGLCNKAYMNLKLEEEFKKSRRYGSPLSLILVDIDNFSDIFQTSGKNAGNEILVNVGSVLLCESRDIDIVGRIEDARFLLLLPSTDLNGAKTMADRVFNNVLERPFDLTDTVDEVTVRVSVGIASCLRPTIRTVDDFLNAAVRGLNTAREHGGNQICVVD